jgi:hypothetical protein
VQKEEPRLILLRHRNGVRRCRLRFRREIGCKEHSTKLATAMKALSYRRTNRKYWNTGSPKDFFSHGTEQQLYSARAPMRTENHQVDLTLA